MRICLSKTAMAAVICLNCEYNPDTSVVWNGVFENRLGSVLPRACAKGMLTFYPGAGLDTGTWPHYWRKPNVDYVRGSKVRCQCCEMRSFFFIFLFASVVEHLFLIETVWFLALGTVWVASSALLGLGLFLNLNMVKFPLCPSYEVPEVPE